MKLKHLIDKLRNYVCPQQVTRHTQAVNCKEHTMAFELPELPYARDALAPHIDYRNARPAYLDAFWNLVNWEFAAANMK